MKEYQVTLTTVDGKYKPVSCIVKTDSKDKKEIMNQGVVKICQKRYWTKRDLKNYGYLKVKIREYDKEKIELEKIARYEQIKEEKYASGEWKRPKEKENNA